MASEGTESETAVAADKPRIRIKSLEDAERKWGRLTYNDADFTGARGGEGADFTDCLGFVRWHPDHGSYSISASSSDEDALPPKKSSDGGGRRVEHPSMDSDDWEHYDEYVRDSIIETGVAPEDKGCDFLDGWREYMEEVRAELGGGAAESGEVPVPSEVAIDAAAEYGGDPLDLCDICGEDRGHHDVSERNRLIPCESDGEWEALVCSKCGIIIERDSRQHDHALLTDDGEILTCEDCQHHEASETADDENRECQFCKKKIKVSVGEVVVLTDETNSCKECYETVSDKLRGHECAENEISLGYFEAQSAEDSDHPQCEHCGRMSEDHTKQFICEECEVCYFCNNTGNRTSGCPCRVADERGEAHDESSGEEERRQDLRASYATQDW